MRITFVGLGYEQLSISQLSAIAKQNGHEVNLAFSASLFNDQFNLCIPSLSKYFDDRKDVIASIKKQKPDVLAFSALTGTYQWMLGIAKEAKDIFPNLKTIFGGAHISAVPELALKNNQIDYVCVGEGDIAFTEILNSIQKKDYKTPIPNTRFKNPNGEIIKGTQIGFIQDLDSLPFFDKPLWDQYIRIGDLYITMASRGCPYRCTFCFNNFFSKLPEGDRGKYVRQRSVEHVLSEIKQIKKRYKLRYVGFEDDVFTFNKKWLKDFVYKFKNEIGVPYQCLTHSKYMDEETAKWLSETGCVYIQLGIQSMDDEYKENIIKRPEKKEHIERAIEVMKKYKINAKCDHMFCLPGESENAAEIARKFFVEHTPNRIQTYWTSFLPGTEMLKHAVNDGIIDEKDVQKINEGQDFSFFRNAKTKDPKKIRIFKSYETLFKLLPILPKFLRKKIKPDFFNYVPLSVCAFMNFIEDVFFGLFSGNPSHISYANHNLYHIYRFILRKLNINSPQASKPLKKEFFYSLSEIKNANQNK